MHEESDPVVALRRLLVVHRRTIEFLKVQRAYLGAFAPPHIWHQFDETCGEITRIKGELRALGASVEDQPDDSAPVPDRSMYGRASDGDALLLVYQRMLVDQVRYLPQLGPSAWGDLFLQLADLYVERTLLPLQAMGLGAGAPAHEQTSTLLDLMRVPGARVLLEGEAGSGKTTCLQMIALACAARAHRGASLWGEHDRRLARPDPATDLCLTRVISPQRWYRPTPPPTTYTSRVPRRSGRRSSAGFSIITWMRCSRRSSSCSIAANA